MQAKGGVVGAAELLHISQPAGFEGDAAMQRAFWPEGAVMTAAFQGNTGDGIRMAQTLGADLWLALPRLLRLPASRSGVPVRHPHQAPARLASRHAAARRRVDAVGPAGPKRPGLHERIRPLHAGHRCAGVRALRPEAPCPRHHSGWIPASLPSLRQDSICVFRCSPMACGVLPRATNPILSNCPRSYSYRLKDKLKAGLVRPQDDSSTNPGGEI